MKIEEIVVNKTDDTELLLIGDENETMINKYLDKSHLYVLYDNNKLISLCAVMSLDNKTVEITNLATYPEFQNKGYASILLKFVFEKYKKNFRTIILGTGENEITLNFYKKFGFVEFSVIKNFFVDNYPSPIFENGRQLIDKIYLKKDL